MYVVISSHKRTNGTLPSKFDLRLKEPLSGTYSLAHAVIPNTAPIFNGVNNKLEVTIAGSVSVISMATNLFTVSDLLADLQTRLNAISNVFTVTQNVSNKRLTISRTGTATVSFDPTQSNASHILGLYYDNAIIGSSGSSTQFDGPLNLAQGAMSYRIKINNLINVEDKDSYSTFYVPVDVNTFDIVSYKATQHPIQKIHFTKPTKLLTVTLCNEDGQVYTSADWEFVLRKENICSGRSSSCMV